MANSKVEGIGPAYADKLEAAGIKDTDTLLEQCCRAAGRKAVSEATGISDTLILKWTNMADLFRINGVGGESPAGRRRRAWWRTGSARPRRSRARSSTSVNRYDARGEVGRWVAFAALAALCAAGAASAQDSWWKKGADLLGGASAGGSGDVAAGLKEALVVGTDNVVAQLGQPGGFENDSAIRIPLPSSLNTVQTALKTVGMSSMLDELELKLNEAAEVATPKAKSLFIDAITAMTLDDAMQIYNGPDDAATRYFQSKMSRSLAEEMAPVVESSLSTVGAVKQYDEVMSQYETIPFMPDAKADLTSYVVEKGMDGIFHYLAEQEAAIRTNPAARTTELLQKVFGK